MTMALVEEQEEGEGAVGTDGLLPRYAVGSEVEVQMADRGFHGAYCSEGFLKSHRTSTSVVTDRVKIQN